MVEEPPPRLLLSIAEEPDENSDAKSSSSPALAASRVLPIVDDLEGGAPLVDEDADAAPGAGCQVKAADPSPPADPLNLQGALPLHSGHEQEKAELMRKVNRLREIAHLYNDAAEEWF